MTPAEVAAALRGPNPPHLLDVRQPDEHAFVALPNSTLIPLAHVPTRADEITSARTGVQRFEVCISCTISTSERNAVVYERQPRP